MSLSLEEHKKMHDHYKKQWPWAKFDMIKDTLAGMPICELARLWENNLIFHFPDEEFWNHLHETTP